MPSPKENRLCIVLSPQEHEKWKQEAKEIYGYPNVSKLIREKMKGEINFEAIEKERDNKILAVSQKHEKEIQKLSKEVKKFDSSKVERILLEIEDRVSKLEENPETYKEAQKIKRALTRMEQEFDLTDKEKEQISDSYYEMKQDEESIIRFQILPAYKQLQARRLMKKGVSLSDAIDKVEGDEHGDKTRKN